MLLRRDRVMVRVVTSTKMKRWRCLDKCPVACWSPNHKTAAWNPIFAGVGACWHLPLQSLERQEGRPHPSLSAGPSPEPLWKLWARASRAVSIPTWMGWDIPHRAAHCSLPSCSEQPLGRGVKGAPALLPSPVWQCLTAPERLCSAWGQLGLPCCNLPICAVDPCRIPSSRSSWTLLPAENPARASWN